MAKKITITVTEFEPIYRKQQKHDFPASSAVLSNFDKIRTIIESNSDLLQFFSFGYDNEHGYYIKCRNYVGTVQFDLGDIIITIEILPKIYSKDNKDEIRQIFLKMLQSTVNINYKKASLADLSSKKGTILEVFISMFADEAEKLIKRGLRCGYTEYSGNESFFKGKLNVSQNIRHNLVHKERFYVTYDVFSVDRSENRLLRSTLEKLRKVSVNPDNQRRILRLLSMMDEVPISSNIEADFAKCASDRNMTGYTNLIAWAKVFLKNMTFTSYSGDNIAYALLFPMEKVFENYIAQQVKRLITDEYNVTAQKQGTYLFNDKFMLKPDIVIEKGNTTELIIDTKWKLLTENEDENYGISQADMYQMYAYAHKFKCNDIVLCYPFNGKKDFPAYEDREGNKTIHIKAVNLSKILPSANNDTEGNNDEIKEMLPEQLKTKIQQA